MWKVDVHHDLQVNNICLWIKQAKCRAEWKNIIEKAHIHKGYKGL
jgi:hypothetical protein